MPAVNYRYMGSHRKNAPEHFQLCFLDGQKSLSQIASKYRKKRYLLFERTDGWTNLDLFRKWHNKKQDVLKSAWILHKCKLTCLCTTTGVVHKYVRPAEVKILHYFRTSLRFSNKTIVKQISVYVYLW